MRAATRPVAFWKNLQVEKPATERVKGGVVVVVVLGVVMLSDDLMLDEE